MRLILLNHIVSSSDSPVEKSMLTKFTAFQFQYKNDATSERFPITDHHVQTFRYQGLFGLSLPFTYVHTIVHIFAFTSRHSGLLSTALFVSFMDISGFHDIGISRPSR